MKNLYLILCMLPFVGLGCTHSQTKQNKTNSNTPATNQTTTAASPSFNADSAYQFTQTQVDFGARVPNTPAHINCGNYIVNQFKKYGAHVIEQKATLKAYDGTLLNSRNIIAEINPENTDRIIICAHWDSRPLSDQDPDPTKRKLPVLAANDGASGVAVLLELARVFQQQKPNIGVDLICFDSEDYGQPSNDTRPYNEDSWALGTQYWAKNLHKPHYAARYGILLDMVGAKGAQFPKEAFSMEFAPQIVNKVWNVATAIGYANYFVNERGGYITDDHYYVNTIAKIPCIDLIHLDKNSKTGFTPSWHTQDDNMSIIDRNTLRAVGETLLNVIYLEQ